METNSERQGGKCHYHPETIAVDMGGKGGRVVKGDMEKIGHDPMKEIDRFFREHCDGDGSPAEISYASREQLVEYVPKIAHELSLRRGVAFRWVMQYGKDRGWT